MRIANGKVADGYASADFTTSAIDIKNMVGFSISVLFTGGNAVGSLVLQGSNDKADHTQSNPTPVNWTSITSPTDSTQAVNVASSTLYEWNASNQFYKWVRVKYTRTSGGSTYTIQFNAKGF